MSTVTSHGASGARPAGTARLDGPLKVRGRARFAYEHDVDRPLYLHPIESLIAAGSVTGLDTSAADATPGVFAVLTHLNAPRMANTDDGELSVLQSPAVGFRGQFIGAVLAETPEIARFAAGLVTHTYRDDGHDAQFRPDSPDVYAPATVNAGRPTDTEKGDVEAALASAPVHVEQTYATPPEHNNPMEPHTCTAQWTGDDLTLYASTQGVHSVRGTLAPIFGVEPDKVHVISPYVGGGFGSKGTPHAGEVLTALAARAAGGRPVKYALTRQQMFTVAGYREATNQRIRLGADAGGRLTAVSVDVVEPTAKVKEFAEQTGVPARMMYAAANIHTTHRLAALDVPVPSWMRAPGECPGMFGLETAMDELAVAAGLDPIELRVRNEPDVDPLSGKPFSARHLIDCLRVGAERFGWDRRSATPGDRQDGDWSVGLGVAASTYPFVRIPGSIAKIAYRADGRYDVGIGAAEIGTGTWTSLTQIAAEALDCPRDSVLLNIGDTDEPMATIAGGSSGTASWGGAIIAATDAFRDKFGDPEPGDEIEAESPTVLDADDYSLHSFGAQFAEVRVHNSTGEVRVDSMLGVFSVGRVINARTARSQFIGGMTMGIGMALHEDAVMDPRFGHIVNHDFAGYHIPACADVRDIDAIWLDEHDEHAGPLGARGIGEIGIVGSAAAIANATYNATGVRVRDLPLTLDKFLR